MMKPQSFSATPTPADQDQGQGYTEGLGCDCGQGSSRSPHLKRHYKQKIQSNVADAGNEHGKKGGFGIPNAPENAAQDIVGCDKNDTSGADHDISHRALISLGGSLHQSHKAPCSKEHDESEGHAGDGKEEDAGANGISHQMLPFLPDLLSHHNGDAHGKARDD